MLVVVLVVDVVGAAVVVDAGAEAVEAGAPAFVPPPLPHPAAAQTSARGTTIHRSRRYCTTSIMVL